MYIIFIPIPLVQVYYIGRELSSNNVHPHHSLVTPVVWCGNSLVIVFIFLCLILLVRVSEAFTMTYLSTYRETRHK
jgi:hypothetical protein